jgi:hypothetical protein
MEINDILRSFETYDKEYKRKEIDEAIAQREEITPHLISVLENVLKDPGKYAERDTDYFAHIYAFMLLGHFKETKAHDVIVDLFSLPGDLPSELFGDSVTGDLPIVLLRTCGGKTDRIKELILNKKAYEYCRGSALQSLSYAAMEGYIAREEIVSFYQSLFTGNEAPPSSCFHDILATCVYDIYPEEMMKTIENAYEEGLIHPGYVGYEKFVEVLKEGKEKCIESLRAKLKERQIDNIHDSMSWWACFKHPVKIFPGSTSVRLLKSKSKQNKKSKKKQSKASKKTNRKKK